MINTPMTPAEICQKALDYELVLACFIESRNMWIVPPPPPENIRRMYGVEIARYKVVAEQVTHYNSHYPKFPEPYVDKRKALMIDYLKTIIFTLENDSGIGRMHISTMQSGLQAVQEYLLERLTRI